MQVQVTSRTPCGVPDGWAVVDERGLPHLEVTQFLHYLANIERSPNTIRAYAYDLALYLNFLHGRDRSLDDATTELLAQFARWLRNPHEAVMAMTDAQATRSRSTANRALAAVAAFYNYLGSKEDGTQGADAWKRLAASANEYRRPPRTVVDNVAAKHRRTRTAQRLGPRLPGTRKAQNVLSRDEITQLVAACPDLQTELFVSLAATVGLRLGQILALRHSDIDTRIRALTIDGTRTNDNGAHVKTRSIHQLPMSKYVSRLYTRYMHEEYGWIDSDYVFVRIKGPNIGRPLTPSAIYHRTDQLKRKTGIFDWSPHTLRHSFVTHLLEDGVPVDVVSKLATHRTWQTTLDVYDHRTLDNLRAAIEDADAWGGR